MLKKNIKLKRSGNDKGGPKAGDLDVRGKLIISGRGHRIDGNRTDRIFDVASGAYLKLHRVYLVNGRVTNASAGAVRSAGKLVVHRSHLAGNSATGADASGGAIFNDGDKLSIRDSSLLRNKATRAGGGIEANAGSTSIVNSLIGKNETGNGPGNSGGVHLTGAGTVSVVLPKVTDNTASAEGGGLWNSAAGTMTVTGVSISGNTAPVGPNVFNLPPAVCSRSMAQPYYQVRTRSNSITFDQHEQQHQSPPRVCSRPGLMRGFESAKRLQMSVV